MNKAHSWPLMKSSHLLGVDRRNLENKHGKNSTCVFSTDCERHCSEFCERYPRQFWQAAGSLPRYRWELLAFLPWTCWILMVWPQAGHWLLTRLLLYGSSLCTSTGLCLVPLPQGPHSVINPLSWTSWPTCRYSLWLTHVCVSITWQLSHIHRMNKLIKVK